LINHWEICPVKDLACQARRPRPGRLRFTSRSLPPDERPGGGRECRTRAWPWAAHRGGPLDRPGRGI